MFDICRQLTCSITQIKSNIQHEEEITYPANHSRNKCLNCFVMRFYTPIQDTSTQQQYQQQLWRQEKKRIIYHMLFARQCCRHRVYLLRDCVLSGVRFVVFIFIVFMPESLKRCNFIIVRHVRCANQTMRKKNYPKFLTTHGNMTNQMREHTGFLPLKCICVTLSTREQGERNSIVDNNALPFCWRIICGIKWQTIIFCVCVICYCL